MLFSFVAQSSVIKESAYFHSAVRSIYYKNPQKALKTKIRVKYDEERAAEVLEHLVVTAFFSTVEAG